MPDHQSARAKAELAHLPAALNRLFIVIAGLVPAISARNTRPCQPKRAGRNKSGHRLMPVALVLLTAFALAACVQSKTPLLTGGKPLLGEQFQLNLYEDFTDGKADSVKTAVFRWSASHYALVSGDPPSGVKSFVAEPLDADTFLIEASDDKVYAYLLGRKLAEGTYRILPVDEKYLDKTTQTRTCVTQDSETCTVATRQQLDTFVHASIGKTIAYTMLVVISVPKN
jgi:hypothetical protein